MINLDQAMPDLELGMTYAIKPDNFTVNYGEYVISDPFLFMCLLSPEAMPIAYIRHYQRGTQATLANNWIRIRCIKNFSQTVKVGMAVTVELQPKTLRDGFDLKILGYGPDLIVTQINTVRDCFRLA